MERLNTVTAKVLDSATETMGDERELQWQQSQTVFGSSRQRCKGQATEITIWEAQIKLQEKKNLKQKVSVGSSPSLCRKLD